MFGGDKVELQQAHSQQGAIKKLQQRQHIGDLSGSVSHDAERDDEDTRGGKVKKPWRKEQKKGDD